MSVIYIHYIHAIYTRYLTTVDASLNPVSATVRVGLAVETVGQAGRPKTITGFQVCMSLVCIQYVIKLCDSSVTLCSLHVYAMLLCYIISSLLICIYTSFIILTLRPTTPLSSSV